MPEVMAPHACMPGHCVVSKLHFKLALAAVRDLCQTSRNLCEGVIWGYVQSHTTVHAAAARGAIASRRGTVTMQSDRLPTLSQNICCMRPCCGVANRSPVPISCGMRRKKNFARNPATLTMPTSAQQFARITLGHRNLKSPVVL